MPPAAPRPYRDFLMPSLHRRFMRATFYSGLICYFISIWQGQWNHWIWMWMPIGPVGMRALFLCISVLTLLIPRVAQFHAGQRNTTSPLETVWKYTLRKATFVTLAAYIISAWLFCEIYIWSRPTSSRLAFTDPGKLHERIKLNERPLFLRFLFVSLAIFQGVIHLWKDYDRIRIGAVTPKQDKKEGATTTAPSDPKRELFSHTKLGSFAWIGLNRAATAGFIGLVVYYGGLRYILWEWHARVARIWFTFGKSARPTGVVPFMELILMYVSEGPALAFLWAFVNQAFDLYMAQEPLKAGNPLTNDSKDPNGSLLNGLKSKKDQVRHVAFWELALITDRFPERRKTIYGELERKKGPTHKQVIDICLAEIKAVVERINAVNPAYKSEGKDGKLAPPPIVDLVPRIAQPLKEGQIAAPAPPPTSRMEMVERKTASLARSHSSPQNAQNAKARELIKASRERIASGAQQAEGQWETYRQQFASSPLGWMVRKSLWRTANTVINGAPFSRQSLIINAVATLTNLAVASLKEDSNGQFQTNIADIVRAFTQTISKIEAYIQGLEVHWTDVDTLALPEAERKKVPEVEEVVDALKLGLEKIVGGFNEYLIGLGMKSLEIQDAKKAFAKPPAPSL